jgi:hypothetical protein
MTKKIVIEDNEDGTTTLTAYVDGYEETFILPFAIDDFGSMLTASTTEEIHDTLGREVIAVPNSLED